jgi:septal ring factor EnvC (AmiA/AmiB activator)
MGAAAYNRGTRLIATAADEAMPAATARAERQALKDESKRLRVENERFSRDLARARRCIAELRRSKEALRQEARADAGRSAEAIGILCRIAFGPGDAA